MSAVASAFDKLGLLNPLRVVPDGITALQYLKGIGPYADRQKYPLPRLILLDLHLPRLTGFRLLEWLRHQPELRHLPVVVLADSVFSPDVPRAYRLGANSFLAKPVDAPEHLPCVREAAEFWLNRGSVRPSTSLK